MRRIFALLTVMTLSLAGDAAAQDSNFWVKAETLLWWVKDGPAPLPVATTAPADSTAFAPGALDLPDTTVLLGGSDIDHSMQVGGRFTIGRWFENLPGVGIEANYLFLGASSRSSAVTSDGSQFLTNPFFDVAGGQSIASVNFLTTPGPLQAGSARLTSSHSLQGAELNGLFALNDSTQRTWSLLAGYRFLYIDESLTLDTTQNDDAIFFPGQFVNTTDDFQTENYFHGGQVGIRGQWNRGRWSLGSTYKVALGNTREMVRTRGTTTTNTGAGFLSEIPVTTVPGGIYAQPTNIGEQSRDQFAVLPEVNLQLGLQLTQNARLFVGYNFLYLSSVGRPGDQMDGTLNSSQLVSFTGVPGGPLVGDARPAPRVESTDYWAQGINLGAELVW